MIMIAPCMYFAPEMYFGEFDYVTCWAIRRVVEFEVMLFDNRRKLPIFREGTFATLHQAQFEAATNAQDYVTKFRNDQSSMSHDWAWIRYEEPAKKGGYP